MKNSDIEKNLKSACAKITPDILDSILNDCAGITPSDKIIMTKRRSQNMYKKFIAIAASAVLVLGLGVSAGVYSTNIAVASTVSLDVNPSVEININKNEKVLGVSALNEDGVKIIGDMDFKGSSLDVTVNALIGSMLKNGYISDITNSILVSVEGKDDEKSAQIQQKVAGEIADILSLGGLDGAVLSQTVSEDAQLKKVADEYGITVGKAQLISQIITQNTYYTFEDLVPLSINELNLLTMSGGLNLENVAAQGQASDKAYIGRDKAKEIALADAGVSEADAKQMKVEMDYERGVMVYDVEFKSGGIEYDYDVNAVSGEIVKKDIEADDDYRQSSSQSAPVQNNNSTSAPAQENSGDSQGIDKVMEKVKAAVLEKAGVNEADVYEYESKLENENGEDYYEVEFKADGYEYDYKLHAKSGEFVKTEKEVDDDYNKNMAGNSGNTQSAETTAPSKADTYIGYDTAKAAALKHAGLSESDIRDFEIELDDDHRMHYEIEFKSGGYEYEYDIDALDGSVLKYDKDYDD